ncbi:hypothetical protein ACFVXC_06115 [Streptomyces sp. NPDC058257]|uniref:hypothetical protein n=1 Tax=Streptomyces sp. NPDC058257 TaxID=3346409 RepID=UPI0036EC3D60
MAELQVPHEVLACLPCPWDALSEAEQAFVLNVAAKDGLGEALTSAAVSLTLALALGDSEGHAAMSEGAGVDIAHKDVQQRLRDVSEKYDWQALARQAAAFARYVDSQSFHYAVEHHPRDAARELHEFLDRLPDPQDVLFLRPFYEEEFPLSEGEDRVTPTSAEVLPRSRRP